MPYVNGCIYVFCSEYSCYRKKPTQSFVEFSVDHFILHVTINDESIKNLYLLTDGKANETVSLFFRHVEKGKRHNHMTHTTPMTVQEGAYVFKQYLTVKYNLSFSHV